MLRIKEGQRWSDAIAKSEERQLYPDGNAFEMEEARIPKSTSHVSLASFSPSNYNIIIAYHAWPMNILQNELKVIGNNVVAIASCREVETEHRRPISNTSLANCSSY